MSSEIRRRLRSLSRAPVFTAGVVLTLSMGIGSSIAIFAIINGILLRPLPFPHEDRLVVIGELRRGSQTPGSVCYRTFAEIRDRGKSFESVALARGWTASIESQRNAEVVAGHRVSHSYFDVIGIQPVRGRFFTPEEDQPGGSRVVVISHGLWMRRFGSDPGVVGKPIRLGGERFEIIGIAPEAGKHPRAAWEDLWTTLQLGDAKERTNSGRNSLMFGKLKEGSSTEQATAEMAALMPLLASTYPETHKPKDSAAVVNLREMVVGATRPSLLTLFGAVSLVLLASCANASNLLLNRTSARRQELAVRAALGASRVRLASDLLSEAVLLSAGGALIGILLALAGVRALVALNPLALPRLDAVTLDVRIVLFALGATLLTGILVASAPTLRLGRDIAETLKQSARTGTATRSSRNVHRTLIIAEITGALLLIVGTSLLARSFGRLLAVPTGFDGNSVLTLQLSLPQTSYENSQKRSAAFRSFLTQIRIVPGVTSAGIARMVPLVPRSMGDSILVEGRPMPKPGEQALVVRENVISSGYFRTMDIAFVQGRDFTEEEVWERGGVIIINKALADGLFPNENPIGRRVTTGYEWRTGYAGEKTIPWFTIVGLVENAVQRGLDREIAGEMFHPYINPYYVVSDASTTLVIRGRPDILLSVREIASGIDRDAAISNVASMDEIADRTLAARRLSLGLFTAFGVVALLIAAVGLYSSVAYAASQRVREVGIRITMGANRSDIVQLFLKESAILTIAGVLLGAAAALTFGGWMSSMLFEVKPWDPVALIAAIVLVLIVAFAASLVPALRASRARVVDLLR